ncbi:MAG: hypothetical protein V7637_2408 [Mycobacteriales bacterium]
MTAPGARAIGLAMVAATALAVAACGHSAGTSGTPAAASPTPDQAAAQRLRGALLTAAELPLGFQQQDSAEASAIGCADIDGAYLAKGVTARAAASFAHAISQAFVNETIALQPGQAAASLIAFGRATAECATFAGEYGVTYRVVGLPGMGRYGDATAAVRVTSTEREARPVDLVAVRLGDMVVIVANAEAGKVDSGLTKTVVARAIDKARRLG